MSADVSADASADNQGRLILDNCPKSSADATADASADASADTSADTSAVCILCVISSSNSNYVCSYFYLSILSPVYPINVFVWRFCLQFQPHKRSACWSIVGIF